MTPINAQNLADAAQSQIPVDCCGALGGTVTTDDENVQVCELSVGIPGVPDLFYLNSGIFGPGACGYAAQVAESQPSTGSGGGQWWKDNSSGLLELGTSIFGWLGNRTRTSAPQIPPSGTPSNDSTPWRGILMIAALVLVTVLVVYLVRRKKK